MKRNILLMGLLISVVLVSGCTGSDVETTNGNSNSVVEIESKNPSLYNPANIQMFMCVEEGEKIRFYFTLEDKDGINTMGDGHASITIKDSSSKSVYTKEFDFSANEFVGYEFKLTGQGIGKVYEWRISSVDIKKGMSSIGTAYLILTTANGKSLKSEYPFVSIPAYTEEEIMGLYEDEYIKSSKPMSKTETKGYFEVAIERLGFFKHLKYDTFGDEVTDFRVDIKVKNIAMAENSLSTYDAKMVVGSNQYDYSYNSKFDGSDIYSGVIKEGYLIFEDVPKDISGEVKIIIGSHYDKDYNKFTHEFTVTL